MDRAPIHDLTLQARGLLVTEIRELLEGVYGLSAEGEFEPTESLPAVEALEEVRETRSRLETLLQDEERAGLKPPEAVEKLVKETAFTHLNRLVAFKMMESRKLMRGAIDRYHDSNGFKFYLADHPDDLALYESGSAAQNALGETPRDIAYRHFLLWQYGQVASEIRVLFDPDNVPSRLFPRPRVLKQLIDWLNAAEMQTAWAPTSDETIGWVYQYFNEEEKIEVFNRLYKKKQKIRRDDIPAATQLFTPRWIVKWLVQNTLGRHWLQMHPDSRLVEHLEYLVPLGGEIPKVALKPVRELELLDPACGTMHFGLVAFDLLVEMYREELERAGSPGWLEEPSVSGVEAIPSSIIENNLFGIDIDLRAVQLSALTLYLKAKSLNKQATFTRSNLACADVLPLDGSRLTEFLEEAGLTRPIYSRLIKGLWNRLQHMGLVGSLMRLEVGLDSLIRQEQQKAETELSNPHLPGFAAEQFETEAGQQEFWDMIRIQIFQAMDEFARQQAERGIDQTFFVGEGQKGLRLLDIMLRRYDVVVCNPPYLGRRNMNPELAQLLKDSYPKQSSDLFSAFIARCMEFTKQDGRCGMITPHSFLFLSSHEDLRQELLREATLETVLHLGPRTFMDLSNPNAIGFASYIYRKEENFSRRQKAVGIFFRLVDGTGEEKEPILRKALADHKQKYPPLRGLWDGIRITAEDIAEVRREMYGGTQEES